MGVKASGGGSQEERVLKSAAADVLSDWSRDGRYLAYSGLVPGTGLDLWVLPLSGEKQPISFLHTPFNEDTPVFSPDGRWIAYSSDESRRSEIYVRPFPVAPGEYQISRDGGMQPLWRDDSKALYFLRPDGTLMEATISTTADFEAGVPRKLSSTGVAPFGTRRQYAVARDGKRFLAIVPELHVDPYPITVVVNWSAAPQK
jgi:Tol biopolymer transport system component